MGARLGTDVSVLVARLTPDILILACGTSVTPVRPSPVRC